MPKSNTSSPAFYHQLIPCFYELLGSNCWQWSVLICLQVFDRWFWRVQCDSAGDLRVCDSQACTSDMPKSSMRMSQYGYPIQSQSLWGHPFDCWGPQCRATRDRFGVLCWTPTELLPTPYIICFSQRLVPPWTKGSWSCQLYRRQFFFKLEVLLHDCSQRISNMSTQDMTDIFNEGGLKIIGEKNC